MQHNPLFILTGGPSSGKTTVLNVLKNLQYTTVAEVARAVIIEQQQTQGDALPWANTNKYTQLMVQGSISDYKNHIQLEGPCFFDRGIPDALGYANLINLPDIGYIQKASQEYLYNNKVFLFPFWPEIYTQDQQRKQNKHEAQQTYLALKKTYQSLGYQILEVPFNTPLERAYWILDRLENS